VRLTFPGPRTPRRLAGLLLAVAAASALANPARAQATKAKAPAPTPPDTRPLARYIPRDNLVVYIETDGLDAHADAWKKTAAYAMLTETQLGGMLEAVAAQLADKALAARPGSKITGADAVAMLKMLAQRGFAFGLNVDAKGDKPVHATLVVRAAAAREYRPQFSRLIGTLMGGAKPQVVKKGTRSVVVVPRAAGSWAWWAEGNDVVFGLISADDADVTIETLDGKRPGAVDHPVRAELAREEAGFHPSGLVFIDPTACPDRPGLRLPEVAAGMKKFANRVDYRWGFQDDALMGVTRIKAPKPRKGLLALFDQPKFEKGKLPPLPEGIETFTVVSANPAAVLDTLLASFPDEVTARLKESIDTLKTKSRIDVRKDLLAQVGPRLAVYTMPGGTSTRSPGDAEAAEKGAADAAPAANGLPGMDIASAMRLIGGQQVPRFTVIAEVKDPVAFGKALDNLMVAVNRRLKEQAAEEADAAAKAAAPAAKPGEAETAGGARGRGARRAAPAAPEFKLMPGKPTEKVYVLQVPAGPARKLPPGVRPTVRLGATYVAIATTPDAARLALEVKPGEWTVTNDLAAAFDQLPKELIYLGVNDSRATTPEFLAKLPGLVQATYNSALAAYQGGAGAGPAGTSGTPGNPSAPNNPLAGGPRPGGPAMAGVGSPPVSGSPPSGAPGIPAPGSGPFSSGMPGMPRPGGGPPGGGEGDAAKSAANSELKFNIEPDKMPKADELRAKMFPGTVAVTSDDQEIKIVTRDSFPDVLSATASGSVGTAMLLPAVQAARNAARRAAAGALPPGGGAGGAAAPPATGTPPAAPGSPSPGRRAGGPPGE